VYKIGQGDRLSNLTEYQQPFGAGPRHLAITSNGQYLYLLHELSVNIRPYRVNQTTGELSQIQDE
jgi:6-phosphogluconolactonase (cycloisomerase 2 family)